MKTPEGGFWAFYLNEHAQPGTRAWHLVGTTIAFVCIVLAIALLQPWFLLPALLVGYLFAWIGHFFVEHNRPATFTYPLRSLAADWKMWALALTGQLGKHLARHGVAKRS